MCVLCRLIQESKCRRQWFGVVSAQVVMRPTSLSERDFRPLPRPLPANTGPPCRLASTNCSVKRPLLDIARPAICSVKRCCAASSEAA